MEYVCGNSDFVVDFTFDAEWDEFETKTARFSYNGTYQDQVFRGTQCPIPIIFGAWYISVGVFAGNLHTTTPTHVPAKRSTLCGHGVPDDPDPDVYAQIMELIQGLGEPDQETIAAAVAEYIAANPIEETDPTVPDWAKAETKPTYTADEVGAADAAAVRKELDSLSEEMLTEESDPTVPSWAKASQKPSYTASEVGADPSGTAASKVAEHNTGTDTHSDIRLLIQGLTDRLNTLADSDDTTLDQLSEVVAYIKSNRSLIEAITTSKVGVSDIVNNLTTNVANKPLSAAQGVALKELIDAISVPDKLPNPNAMTFTGAVTGSYDGSEPLTVEIPSSGSGGSSEEKTWRLLKTIEITEEVGSISFDLDDDGNTFEVESLLIYAGLTVTASKDSQFIVRLGNNLEITSANSFVGTNAKSIYWETHWAGLRVAVMGSSTYDFKGVASTASTVRLCDTPQKIIRVDFKLQGTTAFTAGKFYIYGR